MYLLQSSSAFLLQVRLEIPIGEAEAIEARASEPGLATKRLYVPSYDVPAVVETGAKPLPEADRAGVYTV